MGAQIDTFGTDHWNPLGITVHGSMSPFVHFYDCHFSEMLSVSEPAILNQFVKFNEKNIIRAKIYKHWVFKFDFSNLLI